MRRDLHKHLLRLHQKRKKRGLPPMSRREFLRAVAEHTAARNITVTECSASNMSTVLFAGLAGYLGVCLQEGASFLGWEDAQIKRAVQLKLGTGDPESVQIVQGGVDDFAAIKAQWR